jgi:hypothetical protein
MRGWIESTIRLVAVAATLLLAIACGQDDLTFPELSSGGECGAWYANADGGVDSTYVFKKGETCPCFVWESVRIGSVGGEPNTYINIGELFLKTKHGNAQALQDEWGVSEPKALVLVISAKACPYCPSTISDVVAMRAEFESSGALMVGVCRNTMGSDDVLSLEEADQILVDDDFWPEDLHRTNDAERHLLLVNAFPQAAVIRLSDMKIVFHDAIIPDQLLAIVQNIDQQ